MRTYRGRPCADRKSGAYAEWHEDGSCWLHHRDGRPLPEWCLPSSLGVCRSILTALPMTVIVWNSSRQTQSKSTYSENET